MKRIATLSIVFTAALAVGCNRDSGNTDAKNTPGSGSSAVGTTGTADPSVSAADRDFVRDAVIANMAEVELGKVAVEHSKNSEVWKFAKLMQTDHTAASGKLKRVASRHNIELPAQLDEKHQDLKDKLATKRGPDFDRDYTNAMVEGHEDFIDKLESRVDKARLAEWKAEMADRLAGKKIEERAEVLAILPEKSDNPVTMSINEWAAETYPTAAAHLEAAKLLAKAVKIGATY